LPWPTTILQQQLPRICGQSIKPTASDAKMSGSMLRRIAALPPLTG
jgi:hypothetical protein